MKSKFLLILLLVVGVTYGQTGTWEFDKSPMPVNTGGSSAELVDGKIYVIGGWRALPEKPDSNFAYAGIQVYDPITNSWDTTRAHMPTPRFNCGSTVVEKKIFLFGGNPYNNILEVYDTETNTWDTTRATMRHQNTGSMAVTIGGLIYVGGAWDTEQRIAERFVSYNPETDEYKTLASIPHPVGYPSIEVIGGQVYLFGGISTASNRTIPIKKIQAYDPDNDSWEVLDLDLPKGYWTQGSFIRDSIVYLLGAGGEYYLDAFIEVCRDVVMVDLRNKLCRIIGIYPFNHCYPKLVDLGEEVLIFGGYNSDDRDLLRIEMVSSVVFSYSPVRNPIYPVNIDINETYCSLDDSVLLTSDFFNIAEGEFNAVCQVNDEEGEMRKLLAMFDDGLHGDAEANDGLYGNYISFIEEFEADFCIRTTNTETGEEFNCLDVKKCTSIGPVIFTGIQYFSADTIPDPGDAIKFRAYLQNSGLMSRATNISASFYSLNEKLIMQDYSTEFVDLIPNEEPKMGIILMTARIAQESISGEELEIGIDIYSEGNLFWKDTAYIKVGQGFLSGMEQVVIEKPNEFNFEVFPNPVRDYLYVSYKLNENVPLTFELLDLTGKVLQSQIVKPEIQVESHMSLSMVNLPSGVYFIKLTTEGHSAISRVIRQ